MSETQDPLSAQQREAIRNFVWKCLVPPAVALSILTALGGYSLRGFQESSSVTRMQSQSLDFAKTTGEALAKVEAQKKQADELLEALRKQGDQLRKLSADLPQVKSVKEVAAILAADSAFQSVISTQSRSRPFFLKIEGMNTYIGTSSKQVDDGNALRTVLPAGTKGVPFVMTE